MWQIPFMQLIYVDKHIKMYNCVLLNKKLSVSGESTHFKKCNSMIKQSGLQWNFSRHISPRDVNERGITAMRFTEDVDTRTWWAVRLKLQVTDLLISYSRFVSHM